MHETRIKRLLKTMGVKLALAAAVVAPLVLGCRFPPG